MINYDRGILHNKTILENTSIPNDLHNRNGQLLSKIIRNANFEKLEEETYNYTEATGADRPRIKNLLAAGRSLADPYPALFVYYDDIDWVKLDKKERFTYASSQSNKTEEVFAYNNINKQIKETTTTMADGEVLKTSTQFPTDSLSKPIYAAMVAKNMLQPMIEQSVFNVSKNAQVATLKIGYKDFGSGQIQLEKLKKIVGGLDHAHLDALHHYDQHANLIQTIGRNGVPISYLWGYNGTYPIAEISGASATETDGALAVAGLSRANLNSQTNPATLESQMAQLRASWQNVQISSFITKPLVGIVAKTAPNGLVERYHYDVFNRLIQTQRHSGDIGQQYQYSYASTAPIGCTIPPAPSISLGSTTLCSQILTATGCTGIVQWSNGQTGNSIAAATTNSSTYTATCSIGTCTSASSNALVVPILPSGWSSKDLVSGTVNGCTQYGASGLTLKTDGPQNSILLGYNLPDGVHYVYKSHSGDVSIVVKPTAMPAVDGFRSGIMLRNSLDPQAAMYTFIIDGNGFVGDMYRNTQNTQPELYQYNSAQLNATWLKLDKVGNSLSARFSTLASPNPNNPADWQAMTGGSGAPAPNIAWNGSFYIGFATMAYPSGSNSTQFSNISINGNGL